MSQLNLEGKQVMIARLHSATHVKGTGNLGPLIDKDFKTKNSVSMTYMNGGLFLTRKDPRSGEGFEVWIPGGNIQSLQFEVE